MRLNLLMAFLIFAGRLTAQEVKYEDAMSWRGNSIELHTISDKTKHQACLFLANDDSIKAYLLNDKAELVQQHYFTRQPGEELIGGFVKEGKIYFFVNNARTGQLHNRVFDTKSGEVTEYLVPFDLKKEKLIERISCGDHFLYFTINKKTSELIIYDFYSETQFNTVRYQFEKDIWESLTRSNGFGRAVNVQKVDMEGECAVDIASWKNKVYFDNDTMYLVADSKRNNSRIYIFDLVNRKVDSRLITHVHDDKVTDPLGYSENSFLFEKKLFYVYATGDDLSIQVLDINNGNVLKRYDVKKDEEITFRNTPIWQEGSATAKSTVRELGKTRQLLRKMSLASAVIIPSRNEKNLIELSVGSYQQVQNNTTYPLMGGAVGGAIGGAFIYANVGGFARNGWTKSARFRMLVDPNTFEHIPGELGMTINEKIETNTKGIKIPPEAETLFRIDQVYYHAYYDRKERKLVVAKY